MKKLLPLCLLFLVSCAKEEVQPAEIVSQKTTSTSRIHVAMNYSTTIASGLSSTDLAIQSLDTSYYEVKKNGVTVLSWKSNWNQNSSYTVEDLNSIVPCNTGDNISIDVIHRSPRNINSYFFNGGISQNSENKIAGMFISYAIKKTDQYYDPNRTSFITSMNLKVE